MWQEFHVFFHRCIVVLQYFFIVVHQIDCPGNDDAGICPGCLPITYPWVRGYIRIGTVTSLTIAHISHPFFKKSGYVCIIRSGTTEYLRISGPSQTLVSLWTVGRDAQIVTSLSPHDVAIQLIDRTAAGDERSSLFCSRANYFTYQGKHLDIFTSRYLTILKAEESHRRMEGLAFFVSFQNIFQCCFRTSEVGGIYTSGRTIVTAWFVSCIIQHFSETEFHLRARSTFYFEPNPADHVLT